MQLLVQASISGLLMGGVYALIAAAFSLVFGVMRVVNFAHGDLVVIGMYVAYWLNSTVGLSPYGGLPLTILITMVLGLMLERVFIRPIATIPEHMQMAATIALSLILQNLLLMLFSSDVKSVSVLWASSSVHLGILRIPAGRLAAFLASLVTLAALNLGLRWHPMGIALRAAADNRLGALLVGVPVKRLYQIAFAIAAVAAGIAGTVVVPFLSVTPSSGLDFTLRSFSVVVLGGMGSLSGAMMAAFLIGVVESLGSVFLPASVTLGMSFAVLILAVLFWPSGFLGRTES